MRKTESSSNFEVVGTIHVLVKHLEALDKSMRSQISPTKLSQEFLKQDPVSELDPPSFWRQPPLYRILEHRLQKGQIDYEDLARLFLVALRGVDIYRQLMSNLLGSLERGISYEPHYTDFDLEEMLYDVADLFQVLAEQKGVEIRVDAKSFSYIRADQDLIRRLIINLVDNAVKYSYETSPRSATRFVQIRSWRHSPILWGIEVQNYGVGATANEVNSGILFEYGKRGEMAADRERWGTGVGLAEAKRIVQAHEGTIEFSSTAQAGGTFLTTVTVLLPSDQR